MFDTLFPTIKLDKLAHQLKALSAISTTASPIFTFVKA